MHPSIKTKTIASAGVGELVRVFFNGSPLLALVSDNKQLVKDQGKLLVFLEWNYEKGIPPIWMTYPYGSHLVQSYGNAFEFILDPTLQAVELNQYSTPESGFIEIREDGAFLIAAPPPDSWQPTLFYDLSTGLSGTAPPNITRTYVKKWSLWLSGYKGVHPLAKAMVEIDRTKPKQVAGR